MLVIGARRGQHGDPMDLTPRERAVLDFEREWWRLPGPKESAIRARFAMSPTSYYRLVGELLDRSTSFEYDPLTVARLRRRRDERRRIRGEGRRADPGST
jgi:hypothetical protein